MADGNEQQEAALAEIKILTADTLIMGLPAKFFLLAAAITAGVPVILFAQAFGFFSKLMMVIVGLGPGLTMFYILYTIHENDPAGFDAWRWRAQTRFNGWKAGEKKPRKITLN